MPASYGFTPEDIERGRIASSKARRGSGAKGLKKIEKLPPEIGGKPVWERLPGERQKAFAAFQIYRDQPMVARTFGQVVKKIVELNGNNPEGVVLAPETHTKDEKRVKDHKAIRSQVFRWARAYRWEERLEYYDSYMDKVRIEEARAANIEMVKRHVSIAGMLQQKAFRRLQQMDETELDPQRVLNFLLEGAKMERLARGEPTDRTETNSSKRGGPPEEPSVEALASARAELEAKLAGMAERNKDKDAREAERAIAAGSHPEQRPNLRLETA